jgi:hypothetical protein
MVKGKNENPHICLSFIFTGPEQTMYIAIGAVAGVALILLVVLVVICLRFVTVLFTFAN